MELRSSESDFLIGVLFPDEDIIGCKRFQSFDEFTTSLASCKAWIMSLMTYFWTSYSIMFSGILDLYNYVPYISLRKFLDFTEKHKEKYFFSPLGFLQTKRKMH